jgi:hypothetical protein
MSAADTVIDSTTKPADVVTVDPTLKHETSSVVSGAYAIDISDQQTYDLAVAQAQGLVSMRKKIEEHHRPMKEAARQAHLTVCAAEKALLEPLVAVEPVLRYKIARFHEQQQALQAQAVKEERETAEREAAEAQLAAAIQVEQFGSSPEEVTAVLNTPAPITLPAIPPAPTFQKAVGIDTREYWTGEVVDLIALAKAVGEKRVAPTMIQPHMPSINRMVMAQKNAFEMPGVRAQRRIAATVKG